MKQLIGFKFKIRVKNGKNTRITTVMANGFNLIQAFNYVVRLYPNCAYVNHYEVRLRG